MTPKWPSFLFWMAFWFVVGITLSFKAGGWGALLAVLLMIGWLIVLHKTNRG